MMGAADRSTDGPSPQAAAAVATALTTTTSWSRTARPIEGSYPSSTCYADLSRETRPARSPAALRGAGDARARRDGVCGAGLRPDVGARGRRQAAELDDVGPPGAPRALPARGAGRGAARPPERGGGARRRR